MYGFSDTFLKGLFSAFNKANQADAHEFAFNLLRCPDFRNVGGKEQSIITCKCDHSTVPEQEPFITLELGLNGDKVHHSIDYGQSTEKLSDFKCSRCETRDTTITRLLFEGKNTIVIHLKRFDCNLRKLPKRMENSPRIQIAGH